MNDQARVRAVYPGARARMGPASRRWVVSNGSDEIGGRCKSLLAAWASAAKRLAKEEVKK